MTDRVRVISPLDDDGELTVSLKHLSARFTSSLDPADIYTADARATLICRDNSSRKWAKRWLQQSGFKVSMPANIDDFLQSVRGSVPDVIIVEAWYKCANGERVFRQLQDSSEIDVPIFVLCTSATEINEALDANIFDIARKPFSWQLISRRARHAVAQIRRESEIEETRESLKSALLLANQARKTLRKTEGFEPVTGLPNRSKFTQLVSRGIEAAGRDGNYLAVFTIRMNRFPLVKEAMGQADANRAVAELGERLNASARQAVAPEHGQGGLRTAAVAITGPSEFAVMHTCSGDKREAIGLRRNLIGELAKPAIISGQTIYLSTSIGAAFFPEDASDADTLIMRSEAAMRDARTHGADFRYFSAEMDAAAGRKIEIEQRLHAAIEQGELTLAYQPLVDIASDRIVGTEALLRWPQPDGSFIGPDEFIPLAEESGLMIRIGEFVLDESCRQLKTWIGLGLTAVRMAVNVAKCQLMSESFANTVDRCLRKYALDPSLLELELSERGVLSGNVDAIRELHQLKSLGVSLSIDDFGTGNAAIAYLKELPIDSLKIDRSYTFGLTDGGRDSKITSAMIALGQNLDLTVIAEGVESIEQLNLLKSFGCDEYQGYYRSPAIAGDALGRMLLDQLRT